MTFPSWGFFAALQFLTRLPIRLRTEPNLTTSVIWFPVVGTVLGAIIGGVTAGLFELVPAGVAAAVAVMFGVLITGAFHEDGLADTCDAFGGWTPERRREILKDSRHGSYGVAAMVGTILIRVMAVASLTPAAACAGLVAAHTLGRGAAVVTMGVAAPVPTEGLGADYTRAVSPMRSAAAGLIAVAVGAVAVGWWVLPIVGIVAASTGAVAIVAHRAFGGVSGDILGAIEQVGECVVLIVVSGLAMRANVWWADSVG